MNSGIKPICNLALVSALGGVIAQVLHIPLPWMIGPMVAAAISKIVQLQVHGPAGSRETGQLLIGTGIGLFFTPAVLQQVANLAGLMLLAGAVAILIGYVSALLVARLAGVNRTTAFFACVPGGAAEMVVLGERFGSAADFVAMAQSLRMMLVVLVIPPLFALSGVTGAMTYTPVPVVFDAFGLVGLFLIAAAGSLVLDKIGGPNPWLLGSLLCAAAITATGTSLSSMPVALLNLGQCLIGGAIGSRFDRDFLVKAPRLMSAAVIGVFVTILMSATMGIALALMSGLSMPSLILATAPGGIAEMSITAKMLGLGVPMVTSFHVIRLIVLLTMTAPAYRIITYLNRRVSR
jgi:membrane AbrB-like protein